MKKLYLSKDKKLLGLCGGIADYFNIDPVLVRTAAVCIAFAVAIIPFVIAYLIMALVFPAAPEDYTNVNTGKKIFKSTDKKIAGVCGGLAEYFNIDATLVRLIFALCVLLLGFGLTTYIICAIMFPSQPIHYTTES